MKKKSKYKPRTIIADAMHYVLSGFKPLNQVDDEAVKLKIKNHDALLALSSGNGSVAVLDVLIAAINMSEALARSSKLGIDWIDDIAHASDALHSVAVRGLSTGRFVCKGPELTAINLGMEVHDAQLDACTVAQLDAALKLVVHEIRHKRAKVIDVKVSEPVQTAPAIHS